MIISRTVHMALTRGSTRVAQRAEEHPFQVEIVDLAEIDLPMFAEPQHPRTGVYALAHTCEFSATISRAADPAVAYGR